MSLLLPEEHDSPQETLRTERAYLRHHRKVMPDGMYKYATRRKKSYITGLLIHNVPSELRDPLIRFEGNRYTLSTVEVHTQDGPVLAECFLANEERLQADFGYHWRSDLKHEHLLAEKIYKLLHRRARKLSRFPGASAEVLTRAEQDLLGSVIRDLMEEHFRGGALADFVLRRELRRPMPSFAHLRDNSHASRFVDNYLLMVVKQVLLNQMERKILDQFRFEIEHMATSEVFYSHTISTLIALRILNQTEPRVDLIVYDCLHDLDFRKNDLIDYSAFGVLIAENLFEPNKVKRELDWIREHRVGGRVPMGVELEMSNIGNIAVADDQQACDVEFDNFRYFSDFALDSLTWKVGGHIDDHRPDGKERKQGFLELAPGTFGESSFYSKPLTDDPWILDQLVHHLMAYYPIRPHSLHISFQIDRPPAKPEKNLLRYDFARCLLALGGDPGPGADGKVVIRRVANDEITHRDIKTGKIDSIAIARLNVNRPHVGVEEDLLAREVELTEPLVIQQYKFIRLSPEVKYEPLIVALKSLVLSRRIGEFITTEQVYSSGKAAKMLDKITEWSLEPTPLPESVIHGFCALVASGLENESYGRPAHPHSYISWVLARIERSLRQFNKMVGKQNTQKKRR
jgi:hypothetical protein